MNYFIILEVVSITVLLPAVMATIGRFIMPVLGAWITLFAIGLFISTAAILLLGANAGDPFSIPYS